MSDYYVYLHRKADTGEVFYVGKGRGDRATACATGRNKRWLEVVFRHGRTVEYVAVGLKEDDALVMELLEIERWTNSGATLVNVKNRLVRKNVRTKGELYEGEMCFRWKNILFPCAIFDSVTGMVARQGAKAHELNDVLDGKLLLTSDGWTSNYR